MTTWPTRCTICGITSREMMEICLLPICPPQLQRKPERERRLALLAKQFAQSPKPGEQK